MSFSLSAWLVRLSIRPLSSLSGRHITYQTDEESVRKSKIQNLSDQNVENQCGTEYIVLIHHLYLRFIASCVTSLHSPPSFSLSLSFKTYQISPGCRSTWPSPAGSPAPACIFHHLCLHRWGSRGCTLRWPCSAKTEWSRRSLTPPYTRRPTQRK